MEKELEGRQDQTNNTQYRNGALLCSAHPEIVKDIAETKDMMREVRDYILLRKKIFELIYDNKYLSGVITGVVTGVIVLLIAYFTVL